MLKQRDTPPPHARTLLRPRRIVVMGVSGSGKSTLGEALGERLGIPYVDGDIHHPQANIDKMARGTPLTDADRAGWLTALANIIATSRRRNDSLLLGCSALKRAYRTQLRTGDPELMFLFLDGSYEVILERMQAREHFFSPDMLRTQFETLERPDTDEAVCVSIHPEFDGVVDACIDAVCTDAHALSRG